MNPKAEVFEKIDHLFQQYGIKSVSMDDISRTLGISKKTLYTYVDSKDDLVNKVMKMYLSEDQSTCKFILTETNNSIEEIIQIANHVNERLAELNPSLIYDMIKYYPSIWNKFQQHKETFIYQMIYDNIENGKNQGLYMDDVNSEVIAKIYINKIEIFLENKVFPQSEYNLVEVYSEFIKYHIRGICSLKGHKVLNKHLKELKK